MILRFILLVLSATLALADITIDGTVIENQHFTGQLNIKANNCVVRNCTFDVGDGTNGSWYGIHARYWDKVTGKPFTGNLIEGCSVQGARSAGIYAHYTTIRRCNVFECGADALKIEDNTTVEYCHLSRCGQSTTGDPHADAIQSRGGSNLIIRYNVMDMAISWNSQGYRTNAALMLSAEIGDMENIHVYGNRFEGGNYTIYFGEKSGFVNQNNFIHDNVFGPDFRYGVLTAKSFRGYGWRQRRVSIDRNYWFDGSFMDINTWDGDNK